MPQVLSDSIGPSGLRVPNKIKQGQIIDIYIGNTAPPREPKN
jgi:hypothetical protein